MSLTDDITTAYSDLAGTFGRTVTYIRGTESIALTSRRGALRGAVNGMANEGAYVQTYSGEERFLAADFTLGLPLRGDVITETVGSNTYTYTVVPYEGNTCYRWLDSKRIGIGVAVIETASSGS